ncbi:phage tail fiber domain-containing protein [Klebsiella pneumoniae]|uniref:phage tail fiber domain-containing protein n=3 Tax=Klebsiella pneumoniae TaxID=573 RepID=UPI001D0D9C93|nr:phage tail fiber protein [Klebsiella pneumoniae]
MTVSTQVSRNEYTGNGATTQYDFTFRILDKSHLLVQTLDTSESIVTLTLGTDYTVTGVNRYNGGKVVLTSALPVGYKISIERSTPVTQESSIRNQGGFFPEIHEDAFDKLTMLVQQAYGWWSGLSLRKPSWLANYYDALNNRIRNLRDPSQAQDAATKKYVDDGNAGSNSYADSLFRRALRVPEDYIDIMPSVDGRRGKLLAFDSLGRPIAVHAETDDGTQLEIDLAGADGLKYIGECGSITDLRSIEPSFPGQQIYLKSLYGGWAATAAGMPWGGGKLRHIASLPEALRIDDGGCIFKTAAGNCWVREELLTGQGEIRVEWYLSGGATLVDDGSDYLQAALDTGRLWSQYSDRNKTVRIVMPSLLRITRTITAYTRGVRIDGNHGLLLCTADVEYTKYADLSTNANITATPDAGKDPRLCISLTHGPGGDPAPGFPLPAYSGQKLIKDLNFAYGVATGVSTYQLSTLADTGIAAIGHWGTSTVAAAQGYFDNLSFQGFGVGYINGDNTWGYGFHECKWRQCWLPVWLIPGADNSERYTFIDCVMQDGYRVIYSPWGGDIKFISGSIVHNSGPELEFPTGSNIIDLSPSRIERVDNAHKFLRLSTSRETGDTAQTYPMAHLHDSMILIDGSSVLDAHALFSVGKYCKLLVDNHTWSLKNMAALANMKLLDPADTGGQVIFRNNTCRVGIFSECARDNRLLTSKVPAGRLPSSNITLSGSNAANATISVSGASLTLTVNASAGGSMALLLRVPVDVDMSDWDSFSWKCVFSAMSISNAWNIQAFANVAGADYVNNRVDLGVASLNSVTDIRDVCSNNSYGFKRIQKRADGGWDRVPTEVYFYISSAGAQTAGETFTITRLGLLGY